MWISSLLGFQILSAQREHLAEHRASPSSWTRSDTVITVRVGIGAMTTDCTLAGIISFRLGWPERFRGRDFVTVGNTFQLPADELEPTVAAFGAE